MIIHGKYLFANDLAITGGIGLGIKGGDADGTDIAIEAGVRKYLKVADFAPFIGGVLSFASTNDSDTTDFALYAEGGGGILPFKALQLRGFGPVRVRVNRHG